MKILSTCLISLGYLGMLKVFLLQLKLNKNPQMVTTSIQMYKASVSGMPSEQYILILHYNTGNSFLAHYNHSSTWKRLLTSFMALKSMKSPSSLTCFRLLWSIASIQSLLSPPGALQTFSEEDFVGKRLFLVLQHSPFNTHIQLHSIWNLIMPTSYHQYIVLFFQRVLLWGLHQLFKHQLYSLVALGGDHTWHTLEVWVLHAGMHTFI